MNIKTIVCRSAVIAFAVSLQLPTVPSAYGAERIEEVIVTARKRDESLQDVPISIQAMSREKIERYAATSLDEIVDMANNVEVSTGTSGNGGSFRIRGYGSGGDTGMAASVATNIDGVQTARGFVAHTAFFDLKSVQILKGPQALFYGKDSPAGVIGLEAAMPSDEFETRIYAGFEAEAPETLIEGMVSGPLTDTLKGRLAFRFTDLDGWMKNNARFIENSNGEFIASEPYDLPGAGVDSVFKENTYTARATLDWEPTDNFHAVTRYTYAHTDRDGVPRGEVASCSSDDGIVRTSIPGLGVRVDPFEDCELNNEISDMPLTREAAANFSHPAGSDGTPWGDFESHLVSVNLEWELEWGTISSISGLYTYDYDDLENAGGRTFPTFYGRLGEDYTQWSEELRVVTKLNSPVNFMAGAYLETFEHNAFTAAKIAHFGPDPVTGYLNDLSVVQEIDGDSWSVFGQAIWDISDEWELTAGGRFTHDEKDGTEMNDFVHAIWGLFGIFAPQGSEIAAAIDDDAFSPEVTLTWRPTSRLTLWTAYKTGYKSGGFSAPNTLSADFDETNVTFDAEEAKGFEAGFKSQWLDDTIRLNVTVYSYDFDDLQVNVFNPVTTSFKITNAASAETDGIEFDLSYLATEYLTLYAEAGYNDAKYASYPSAACYQGQPVGPSECIDNNGDGSGDFQDLSGTPLVQAPDITGSFGFELVKPVANNWSVSLAGEAIYSDSYITTSDGLPTAGQPSFWRLRARVGLASLDGHWNFAVVGRNLTSEDWPERSISRPGAVASTDQSGGGRRPRQILFEASYRL